MPIATNNSAGGDKAYFFTPEYKTLIRSLKEILISTGGTLPIPNPNDRYAYRYDFYRLLRSLKVPVHLWWTVAYLNDIENTSKDNSKLLMIISIEESAILAAISRSNTQAG